MSSLHRDPSAAQLIIVGEVRSAEKIQSEASVNEVRFGSPRDLRPPPMWDTLSPNCTVNATLSDRIPAREIAPVTLRLGAPLPPRRPVRVFGDALVRKRCGAS